MGQQAIKQCFGGQRDHTNIYQLTKEDKIKLEKRAKILTEIVTTEEFYVKGLEIIDNVYRKPMKEQKIISNTKILNQIFQSDALDMIIGVNQHFLNSLKIYYDFITKVTIENNTQLLNNNKNNNKKQKIKVMDDDEIKESLANNTLIINHNTTNITNNLITTTNNTNTTTINGPVNNNNNIQNTEIKFTTLSEIFLHHAHSLKLYSTYIHGFKKQMQRIEEEKKKNKKFNNFLKETKNLLSEQKERIIDFESYLITPIQRIPRYRLLLEDYIKFTPREDRKLLEALDLIKNVANFINETECQMENIQILREVVHKLNLTKFIKQTRYLLLYYSEENNKPIFYKENNKLYHCELYLCNDVLVLHKRFDQFLKSKVELYTLQYEDENIMITDNNNNTTIDNSNDKKTNEKTRKKSTVSNNGASSSNNASTIIKKRKIEMNVNKEKLEIELVWILDKTKKNLILFCKENTIFEALENQLQQIIKISNAKMNINDDEAKDNN
ncbi:hypothetical protein ABK040_015623 [Willaertia magna]